jgi:hypothetical protein
LRAARELLLCARVNPSDMDRWFVRTDAYLEAIEAPEFVEAPRTQLWVWLLADVILASMTFVTFTALC